MDENYTASEFLASDLAYDVNDHECLPVKILGAIEETRSMVRHLPPGRLTVERLARFEVAVHVIHQGVDLLIRLGAEMV